MTRKPRSIDEMSKEDIIRLCKSDPRLTGWEKIKDDENLKSFVKLRTKESVEVVSRSGKIKIYKNPTDLSNEQYMFDDFDGDGILNIDDRKPFEYSNKTVEESNLSDIIIDLREKRYDISSIFDKSANKARKILIREDATISEKIALKKRTPDRVKKPISTLEKLVRKYVDDLYDFAAMKYIASDYDDLIDSVNKIMDKFDIVDIRNYYETYHPSGYRGIHIIVDDWENIIECDEGESCPLRFEIQFRTSRINFISKISHELYKKKKADFDNYSEMVELATKADMGDIRSIKNFGKLTGKNVRDIASGKETLSSILKRKKVRKKVRK
jgi:ppGpp synthetase/RelA/SpoT-type nucleotidyltranferase